MVNSRYQPALSIITPSYNQAAYLEQAIRSVLAQEYTNLEYIIVDGASTDNSPEIIRRYAGHLAWWCSESDNGQAEAINKGFRRASGEIVAWLNSDDLYLPGAFQKAVEALEGDPELGLVFGDAITIDADGRPLNHLRFGDWGLAELSSFRIICQPAVFMRRAILEKAGYLDPSYHYMLDHHLWLRIARLAPLRHIPHIMAAARHHPAAKNVSQAAGFGRETLRLLEWMHTQPDRAWRVNRRTLGGAYRLNARYLLDGGQYSAALREYGRALLLRPGYTLQHWRRILYAFYRSVVPGSLDLDREFTRPWISRLIRRRPPDLKSVPGLEGWPGLKISKR